MAQALGLISVVWNGIKVAVEKGGTFQNGGLKQKGVINGQQVDYANEYDMGKTSVTKRLLRKELLAATFTAGEGELQVQCDTGQTYVGTAFLSNTMNFVAGDGGKVKLEWTHGELQEQLNG